MKKLCAKNNYPWFYKLPLDLTPQLFYNQYKTDYTLYAYVCSCGKEEFIIQNEYQNTFWELEYICQECGNSTFYDANMANRQYDYFLQQYPEFNPNLDLGISYKNNRLISYFYVELPYKVDFLREKVFFKKKKVYSLTVGYHREEELNYETGFLDETECLQHSRNTIYDSIEQRESFSKEEITDVLNNTLFKQIIEKEYFNISKIDGYKKLTHKQLAFYLLNPHFRDRELLNISQVDINYLSEKLSHFTTVEELVSRLLIRRKEKSIKKALYSVFDNKSSSLPVVYLFLKHIRDVNILRELINLKLSFSGNFYILDFSKFEMFLSFLKRHFSEILILGYFRELQSKATNLFIDSLNLFSNIAEEVEQEGISVKCKVYEIHQELVQIYDKILYADDIKVFFTYDKKIKQMEIEIDKYQVRLPSSGEDLYHWGKNMNNCVFSYTRGVKEGQSFLFGFFENDYLSFIVEYSNSLILQASGFANSRLDKEQQNSMEKWLQKCKELEKF